MAHTLKKTIAAAALALSLAVSGLAVHTPPASQAADSVSASQFWPSIYPWLCKGGMAGYKFFEFSNCTGRSAPAIRRV